MAEHRMMEEDGRGIKVRRTKDGDILDASDVLTDGEDEVVEEEILFDFSEAEQGAEDGNYDDDLVGLTPTRLAEALARKEKERQEMHAESENLRASGEEYLHSGDFENATVHFDQALMYDGENVEAHKGYWTAVTQNFTDFSPLYKGEYADRLVASPEEVKAFVRGYVKETFEKERVELLLEAEPLRERYDNETKKRAEAFKANFNYYFLRFSVSFGVAILMLVGMLVSIGFLTKTTSMAPIVLTIVFGALLFIGVAVAIVYARGLIVAGRYVRKNNALASTEDGRRLAEIEEKLDGISAVLDD